MNQPFLFQTIWKLRFNSAVLAFVFYFNLINGKQNPVKKCSKTSRKSNKSRTSSHNSVSYKLLKSLANFSYAIGKIRRISNILFRQALAIIIEFSTISGQSWFIFFIKPLVGESFWWVIIPSPLELGFSREFYQSWLHLMYHHKMRMKYYSFQTTKILWSSS